MIQCLFIIFFVSVTILRQQYEVTKLLLWRIRYFWCKKTGLDRWYWHYCAPSHLIKQTFSYLTNVIQIFVKNLPLWSSKRTVIRDGICRAPDTNLVTAPAQGFTVPSTLPPWRKLSLTSNPSRLASARLSYNPPSAQVHNISSSFPWRNNCRGLWPRREFEEFRPNSKI